MILLLLQAKEPKAVLKVDTINATFQPDKIGNPNGLQITYLKDYSTRNVFVYHDNGKVCVSVCVCLRVGQLMTSSQSRIKAELYRTVQSTPCMFTVYRNFK